MRERSAGMVRAEFQNSDTVNGGDLSSAANYRYIIVGRRYASENCAGYGANGDSDSEEDMEERVRSRRNFCSYRYPYRLAGRSGDVHGGQGGIRSEMGGKKFSCVGTMFEKELMFDKDEQFTDDDGTSIDKELTRPEYSDNKESYEAMKTNSTSYINGEPKITSMYAEKYQNCAQNKEILGCLGLRNEVEKCMKHDTKLQKLAVLKRDRSFEEDQDKMFEKRKIVNAKCDKTEKMDKEKDYGTNSLKQLEQSQIEDSLNVLMRNNFAKECGKTDKSEGINHLKGLQQNQKSHEKLRRIAAKEREKVQDLEKQKQAELEILPTANAWKEKEELYVNLDQGDKRNEGDWEVDNKELEDREQSIDDEQTDLKRRLDPLTLTDTTTDTGSETVSFGFAFLGEADKPSCESTCLTVFSEITNYLLLRNTSERVATESCASLDEHSEADTLNSPGIHSTDCEEWIRNKPTGQSLREDCHFSPGILDSNRWDEDSLSWDSFTPNTEIVKQRLYDSKKSIEGRVNHGRIRDDGESATENKYQAEEKSCIDYSDVEDVGQSDNETEDGESDDDFCVETETHAEVLDLSSVMKDVERFVDSDDENGTVEDVVDADEKDADEKEKTVVKEVRIGSIEQTSTVINKEPEEKCGINDEGAIVCDKGSDNDVGHIEKNLFQKELIEFQLKVDELGLALSREQFKMEMLVVDMFLASQPTQPCPNPESYHLKELESLVPCSVQMLEGIRASPSDFEPCRDLHKPTDENPYLRKNVESVPNPKLLKEDTGDMIAPKRNWTGRGYGMFGCGGYGRRCSEGSGGGSGSGVGGNRDSSEAEKKCDRDSTNHRRNQSNRDGGGSDDRNSNNHNNNDNKDNSWNKATRDTVESEPTRDVVYVTVPPNDHKRHRKKNTDIESKKHSNLYDFAWLEKISREIAENECPTGVIFRILSNGERNCVEECLTLLGNMSHDALGCSVCITVDSLLKHYANCLSVYNGCDMCVKVFSLMCSHVVDCINNNAVGVCEIKICEAIKILVGNDISTHMKTLWFRLRKKLARIIDGGEEEMIESQSEYMSGEDNIKLARRPSRVSASHTNTLPSIPEATPLSMTPSTSRSGSRILRRKKSNLANVNERAQTGVLENLSSGAAALNDEAGAQEAAGVQWYETKTHRSEDLIDSKNRTSVTLYSRAEINDESDAIPTSSEEGSAQSMGSGSADGSGQFVLEPGRQYVSLPMGPPRGGEPYFPSVKDKPTGKKGIGEVVYADKQQLVVVVSIWEKFKTQYLIEAKLAKHYTEEGVILSEFKSKLRIEGLRYQNEFQWVKVAHLGNGMTGKCHLAMDFETEFKFCVKEIHISNYEMEEIELWSELEHPYVVQVYGAIRHAEKIYILQEFIEGGCLTEAINVQKKLGRRLSQLTALRYFQQLLEVLKYLKSRNMLHEDLKADNILLNKTNDKVTIKVADFGLARRCPGSVRGGTTPVGTQTQWSPEKAEAVGYGFAAEVWAAVCVLVHMLSGLPPWIRRYESYKALIVVIVEKSPPIEDIPKNINASIKDLIGRGFTVCQGQRPNVEQLLTHDAFRLLEENPALQPTNGTYSILESMHVEPTNEIVDDPNADLREIYRNLEFPNKKNSYTVYTTLNEGGGDRASRSHVYRALTEGGDCSASEGTGSNGACQRSEPGLGEATGDSNIGRSCPHSGLPSHPDDNLNPIPHMDRFLNDNGELLLPPPSTSNLIVYHPSCGSIGSHKDNGNQYSNIENLSGDAVIKASIPDFRQLLADNSNFEIVSPDDDDNDYQEYVADFDFQEGLKHVEENYTLPTVVTSVEQLSPVSTNTSAASSSGYGISSEKIIDANYGSVDNDVTSALPGETKFGQGDDDNNPSITDDDELFISGSPTRLDPIPVPHPPASKPFSAIPEQPELNNSSSYHRTDHMSLTLPVDQVPRYSNPREHPHTAPPCSMYTTINPHMSLQPTENIPPFQHSPERVFIRPEHLGSHSTNTGHLSEIKARNRAEDRQHDYRQQPGQHQQLQRQLHQSSAGCKSPSSLQRTPPGSNSNYSPRQFSPNNPHSSQISHSPAHLSLKLNTGFQGQCHINRQRLPGQSYPYPSHYGNSSGLQGDEAKEVFLRPESDRDEYVHQTGNPHNRDTQGLASMPNAIGNIQITPIEHASLYGSDNSFQTSTPIPARYPHNGARPKVPQPPRQLFTIIQSQEQNQVPYSMTDYRQGYEQRPYTQHQGYHKQPKTPIWNPVINPRPPTPQEGQRMDLRLDIGRAQHPPSMPVLSHSQTAPVFSPPKTPSKKSPDFHRTMSELPPVVRYSPPQTGFMGMSSSSSVKDDKLSTSTSKSQFEEQDDAFKELSKTAEEALSQHSEPSNRLFFNVDDDSEEEVEGELDDRYMENPAESLAHLLDDVEDESITITFRSDVNSEKFKMKFSRKHTKKTWEKIIREDLDGFSRVYMADFGLERFCLKLEGTIVYLNSLLGNRSLTVVMVVATDSDPWWIEGGMLYM